MQNNFLENRFQPKIFIKNLLVENFLWLQNHFLENRFEPKIFIKKFWSKIFYGWKFNSSKQVGTINYHTNSLVENFLWLQNHFLENRFEPKIFIKKFLVEIFYGCKLISSEIGLKQKFSSKLFWWKIFYGCKIIS